MYITLAEFKQWFEQTKLDTVTAVDVELEATASTLVLGRLADTYTITTWLNYTSTPTLVRKIIAMLVAAWYYQRSYSDDSDMSNYAVWLEGKAYKWLEEIASGELNLTGVEPANTGGSFLAEGDFWPNDTTTDGPFFLMGTVF